jgi:uncharacterized membrane protein
MRAFLSLSAAALAVLALTACQPKSAPQDNGSLKAVPATAPSPAAPAAPAAAPVRNGVDQSPLLPIPPAGPDAAPTVPAPPASDQGIIPPAPIGGPAPPAPPAPSAPAAPPPPAKPQASAFDGAFDLVGTEPFWNLKIRPAGLTLSRASHEDLTAPNPGFTELGRSALWTATAGQSRLTVTVTRGACTDGMSDRTYPYAAKVTVWGTTLSGCAAKVRA